MDVWGDRLVWSGGGGGDRVIQKVSVVIATNNIPDKTTVEVWGIAWFGPSRPHPLDILELRMQMEIFEKK